jgi:diaminohydroxyphosphoribosylaminopyrimidine deaminase / 5-amino-6-(5-phosphoribosylamino)uracil reductase
MNHEFFMQLALELAEKGRGYTAPNPMVGAVVVKDGQVVGQGYHQAPGGPHAEVNAIAAAGGAARGADLYVNLEPCNHTGRTPPCTAAILAAGIRRVVMAMADPNPDVAGGGRGFLEARGVEVLGGVCEAQALRLNEVFVKFVRTRRPFVALKCAATLDGRIATRTGDARWVTGEPARLFGHRLRHWLDGILVGVKTVRADDPSLTARLDGGGGRDPVRLILDTHLSTPPGAKMLRQKSESDTIIFCQPSADPARRRALTAAGARVLAAPEKGGRIDLAALMKPLAEMGVTSLLIEGGAEVIAAALAADIVDKIYFFYAPKILGGDDGVPICRGPGPALMRQCKPVRDLSVRQLGEDVLISGYLG